MNIKEWAITFVKHRDLHFRKIKEIKDIDGNFFEAINKDNSIIEYIVSDKLTDKEVSKIDEKKKQFIIIENTVHNIKETVTKWKKLVMNQELTMVFVNINKNDKFIIKPYVHNKITEEESLEQGLLTLHENIL